MRVTFYKNGQQICNSEQLYGMTSAYQEAEGSGHAGHGAAAGGATMQHISNSGLCADFGTVAVGDELVAVSAYNTTRYPLQIHNGEAHPVMVGS